MGNASKTIAALLIGTLFGAGLAVSQMMNPAKVIAFLDVAGAWDPTLATVMIGALVITFPTFAFVKTRTAPLLGGAFQIPTRKDLDARLIGGAALFGIGWGIAGFCPGPAISALSSGLWPVFVFVAAMIAGMFLHRLVPATPSPSPNQPARG